MKSKLVWLLSLPGRLIRSLFGSIVTVTWSERADVTELPITITVDSTQLRETLALLEQITAAAEKAEAAMGAVGVMLPCELAAAEFACDETPALTLNELQAIRAELKALRLHAGASPATIKDSERFAHMPPPVSAKRGHWMTAVGSPLPVWVEEAESVYDSASGAVVLKRR